MNLAQSQPRSAAPLVLTKKVLGPWLGIRYGAQPTCANIVLVNDPRSSPSTWRTLDADARLDAGDLRDAGGVISLLDFGVMCSIYKHGAVLSAFKHRESIVRRGGELLMWAGREVDRIKFRPTDYVGIHAAVDAMRLELQFERA